VADPDSDYVWSGVSICSFLWAWLSSRQADRQTRLHVRQKVIHWNYLPFFSATARNFNVKFYPFMLLSYLHLTAKRRLIIFKCNEVIDILAWPHIAIFLRLKTFAPKHSKSKTAYSPKQHGEHFVWCFTVTFCARIVFVGLLFCRTW